MKVILKKHVNKLGEPGDVVDVANGYGRNFLIPKRLAVLATDGALRQHAEEERQAARKRLAKQEEAEEVKDQIEDLTIQIPVKVGEEDRIFGTVTTQQIAVNLSDRGFEIDRRTITLDEDIRHTGVYHASIDLHKEVTARLKIEVVSQG